MAIQSEYGKMKAESDEITKLKEEITAAFKKHGHRCNTCGELDYEIKHPKAWSLSPPCVHVNCKRCGRKHYFDLDRLPAYLESLRGATN